MYLPLLKLS